LKTRLLLLILLFTVGFGVKNACAQGTVFTWAGPSTASSWSNNNNWSVPLLGTGISYPGDFFLFGTSDVAYFPSNANVTIAASGLPVGQLYEIEVADGKTVTITLDAGIAVTNIIQVGTSTGGTLIINGPGSISGGSAITVYGTGTLTSGTTAAIAAASLTFPGSAGKFTDNGGCTLSGAITLNGSGTIGGSSSISAASMAINNASTLTLNQAATINGATAVASGGTVTTTAALSTQTMTVIGSTFNLGAALNVTGTTGTTLTFTSGATVFNTSAFTTTLSSGGSMVVSTGSVSMGSPLTLVKGSVSCSGASSLTANAAVTLTTGSLNLGGSTTVTANAPVAITGTININGSCTITGTNTVTATSLPINGTYTLTAGATNITISGAMSMSSGSATITFVNNASGGSPTLSIGGGVSTSFSSLSFTATNPGTANITGNMTIGGGGTLSVGSGVTMGLTSGTLSEPGFGGTFTNAGNITATAYPFSLTSAINFTNSGTLTTYSNINLEANGTSFTNTGTITVNPSATNVLSTFTIYDYNLTFNNTYVSAAFPGVINLNGPTSNTTTLFTISNSAVTLNNSGTIKATNAPILWSGFFSTPTTNSGTITLISSAFTVSNATTINNTGTFSATSSTLNLSTSASQVVNFATKSPGTCTLVGTTVNLEGNSESFSNTGTVTASGGSFFYIGGGTLANINNSGVFNAGLANSACSISSVDANSQMIITNTGTFNVGSTSIITLNGTSTSNPSTVTNTSPGVFTFESDRYGSATIGKSGTPTGSPPLINQFSGTFNVQRYMSGGTPPSGGTTYRSYHLLSTPVNISSSVIGTGNIGLAYTNTAATVKNPNANTGTVTYNGAYTAGPGTGFTINGAGNPTMYLYEESKATNNSSYTGGKTIGIYTINSTGVLTLTGSTVSSSTVALPVGTGYYMYYIGTDTLSSTSGAVTPAVGTTLTATGTINQGSITYSSWNAGTTGFPATGQLSYASTTGTKGFNMVGNPYPSMIDLNQVYTDNPGGYTTFYELSPVNPGQGFSSWNGKLGVSNGGSNPSRYVASGQGFFVLATTTGQSLKFNEDQKVYLPGTLNYSSSPPSFLSLRLPDSALNKKNASLSLKNDAANLTGASLSGLHLMLELDSNTTESCGIFFVDGDSDGNDNDDGIYLSGFGQKVQMSSYTADGLSTSINAMADYKKGKRIKLFVKAAADGQYSISMTDIQNINTSLYNVYLVDNLNKDSLDMVQYKTYKFDLVAADTASFANRFVLAVEKKPLPPYQLIAFTGQKANTAIQLNWKTYNEGDYTNFVLQKQDANGQFNALYTLQSDSANNYGYLDPNPVSGNNIYRLQQTAFDGTITYSASVTVTFSSLTVSGVFSIYPNPSREMITVSINSTNSTAPNYVSNIYNTIGELMGQRTVSASSWTEDISSYKAGVYVIILKDNGGNLIGKSKFVKTN